MTYFIFSVANNRYALDIENIQRIIQAKELTAIPGSSELIDGMMSYQNSVIKVLNFRKLIGLAPYDQELQKSFTTFKALCHEWMSELKESLEGDTAFTKTTNPHESALGLWLNSFHSYDEKVTELVKNLAYAHKNLYSLSKDALECSKSDKAEFENSFKRELNDAFKRVINSLELFNSELESISNSLQKLILYEKEGIMFAIKVDKIESMEHIEDSKIMMGDSEHSQRYLGLCGTLELHGHLVNVIKNIDLPK